MDALNGNVPQEWKDRSNKLRSLYTKDKELYKQHKSKAPIIMPSGVFEPTKAKANIISHSSYISIDIDPDDNPNVEDWTKLKNDLTSVANIAFLGHSLSGRGLWGLIPIDLSGCQTKETVTKKHEAYAKSLLEDFRHWGVKLDASCCNVNRIRYYAVDDDPYINIDAKTYTKTLPEKKKIIHKKRDTGNGLTPWDAYNNDSSNPHLTLLHNQGWKIYQDLGHCQRWTRPDKSAGVSADYDVANKWLYVFTSSTQFEANEYYRPFEIYTRLCANNDFKQAAKQLRELGYVLFKIKRA